MIDRDELFRLRTKYRRLAVGVFTATHEDQLLAVRRAGRRGITPTRWLGALRVVWEGAGDEWIPKVTASLNEPKGAVVDAGLEDQLIMLLTEKADDIVEITQAQFASYGIEGLEAFEGKAVLAANTEPTQALAWSQHETAVASPLQLRKVWQSIVDDRTRESHLTANGQERLLDDPFDVGGAALQWPAEVGGPAGEVINCRCWEDYTLS